MRATGLTVGLGSSNAPVMVTGAQEQTFLNVHLEDFVPAGCDGMATVHVFAREFPPGTIPENPDPADPAANSKVLVSASWQSHLAGGDVEVDGAHGFYLQLGANTAVNLRARLVPAVDGAELVVGSVYRMEAVVKWYTSVGDGRPLIALPARPNAEEGGLTTFWKIPRQARSISAFALDPAAYASLTAELATVDAGAAVRYTTLVAPRREPIVVGVEWARLRSGVITSMFPVFELWA